MSSQYCFDIQRKFALLPLLVKYKKNRTVLLQTYYLHWKTNTLNSRQAKFISFIMKYIINTYGSEVLNKLRELAIYQNILRLQRKKMFYLLYPLLKKILLKKAMFFNIWNKRSKNIKVLNPIKPIRSFIQLIKRKLSFGKEKRMKGFVNKVDKVMKKYFIRKLKKEAKRKFVIYFTFLLRKGLKGHLPMVFRSLTDCYYKTISSEGTERHLKGKKRLVKTIIKTEEDKGIASDKKAFKQQNKNAGSTPNENFICTIANDNMKKLALFTILKILFSIWKKKIKTLNYKASGRSKMKNNMISGSKIIKNFFLKKRLEKETVFMNHLKHKENNEYYDNNTQLYNNKKSNNSNINYQNQSVYRSQAIQPFLHNISNLHTTIGLLCFKKINKVLSSLSQKNQCLQFLKEKILISHGKTIHSQLFAFVKWSLISKLDKITKEKIQSLYHNFQSTYLKALGEMKDIESSFTDNNLQLNLYDYSFISFKHRVDRRIDPSFGKNILFS